MGRPRVDDPGARAKIAAAAEELFACANGLLHLPSGKIYPATPDYFCVNASTRERASTIVPIGSFSRNNGTPSVVR